ncbi:MAG: hypothetical protein AB7W16_02575 [Candidatus Obscuribacterales bacterium]
MNPRKKSRTKSGRQLEKQASRKSKQLQDLYAVEVMNPDEMKKKSGGDIHTTVIVKP